MLLHRMGCQGSVMEDPGDEYDSTWDDEMEEEKFPVTGVREGRPRTPYRNLRAAKDMQRYRHMCQMKIPVNQQHGQKKHNLHFYLNESPSLPDGVYIEKYHKNWFGDYTRLETAHSYIQWLFPIQEPGLNSYAHVLTAEEIQHFRRDKELKRRLLESYKLMLDFYGIRLVNGETGEVHRAANWKERFENLNRNSHNNLRITRILKCLGILGFQHYQKPLVQFILKETLVNGTLPQVKQSALDYFMFAVLSKSERKELIEYAFCNFEPKEQFVWCPRRIQIKLFRRHFSLTHDGAIRGEMHPQPDYERSARNSRAQKPERQKGPRHPHPSTQNLFQKQNIVSRMDMWI